MKLSGNYSIKNTGKTTGRGPLRLILSAAVLGVATWTLLPAAAAPHGAPPPPPVGGTAPAPHGTQQPGTAVHGEGSSLEGEHRSEQTHLGAQEPGPGGSHGPQGSEHAVGEPGKGHAPGEHGEEHGEAHGEEHGQEVSIHNPTWIYALLQRFWYSGPATLTADGAVYADTGEAVAPAELKGKQVEYVFHPHHTNIKPAPEFHVTPTLGEIGSQTPSGNAPTETVTVDGRAVTLVNPVVKFALEGMFPEGLVISLLTALTILLVAILLARNLRRIPSRRQTLLEEIYRAFDGFVKGLIGPGYKKYVPLIATGFIYILVMNLAGLIPGWMSPTSNINVTAGLAIVVVVYSHIEGIRANGLKGYFMHFVGEPWWLGPLNVPIHFVGELAKVLSLTIRLFGNIFGEDVVLVILMYLAALFTQGWLPFQFPMYFLVLFTSFVQAMVFSILASVYIALMTVHDDHAEHHGEHDHGDHGHLHDHAAPAPAV